MSHADGELARVRPALVAAHRADRADPAEIQRAYLRFTWGRRRAPARLPVVRWLLAGMAIGLGIASAATLVQQPSTPSGGQAESTSSAGPSKAKRRPLERAAPYRALEADPALAESLPAEPTPKPPPPSAAFAQPELSAPRVAQQRSPAPASAASSAAASDWQRAAAALRSGDLSTAEAALAKLEQSDSLRDRQAAELARAQLLVDRGRVAEAVPTLQRLAREGGSPVVRTQAASMLRNLEH